MLTHFIFYGLCGFIIEIIWTGFGSLILGDLSLKSKTYLWMFFIYGMAVFFEPIHKIIRRENFIIRGLIWVFLIYFIEFSSGFLLDTFIGFCPWDYSHSTKYTFYGYIRLDYFFPWFIAGLLFEKLHDLIDRFEDKLRT